MVHSLQCRDTGRDIATLSGFQIIVTSGIKVVPPSEQLEKEVDLFLRGTAHMDGSSCSQLGCIVEPKIFGADKFVAISILTDNKFLLPS